MGQKLNLLERMACALYLGAFLSSCGWAEPRSANSRFETQFSESGIFECKSGSKPLGLGVSSGLPEGVTLPSALTAAQRLQVITVEIEQTPRKKNRQIDRLWGFATFEDGDKRMIVSLNNGQTVRFERFGRTPDWPFKDAKDSQLFFTFRINDGQPYQCKSVYQPDQ